MLFKEKADDKPAEGGSLIPIVYTNSSDEESDHASPPGGGGDNEPINGDIPKQPTTPTSPTKERDPFAPPPGSARMKGPRLSISDRMTPIIPQGFGEEKPKKGRDHFHGKWWKPSVQRVKSADNQPNSFETHAEHADEHHDNHKRLSPLVIPPHGGSASRISFSSSDNIEMTSPAERVRQILGGEEEDDAEDADVMSGLHLHALFCQMDVLCHFDDGVVGWKEYARWLKYEEKVESGDRWSKPHVPTTSLHSLFEIRKAISERMCTVVLDMSASHGCMHQVADGSTTCHECLENTMTQMSTTNTTVKETNKQVKNKKHSYHQATMALNTFAELIAAVIKEEKQLTDEQVAQMVEVLIRPHKHKHRKGKKMSEIKEDEKKRQMQENNNHPKKKLLDGSFVDETMTSEAGLLPNSNKPSKLKTLFGMERDQSRQPRREASALTYTYPGRARPDELKAHKPNKKLMGKIPGGSESANIMIGQVDFLEEPIMAFVRLSKPAVLSDLTEVSVPTRFVFMVMGPPDDNSAWEYEEIGRAMASLFIDRVFCEVAYKASTRQDLVDGIDEYVDDLTVLPPSIWDPSSRLEPPEQAMSMDKIRRRLMDSSRHAPGEEAFHMSSTAGEDITLSRTGRLFGGMWLDMKRRYSQYWSDIRDGFHPQCLATILFLYFACITPIVTFGGLLGGATEGVMGTMETIMSGFICGIIYHTFSGQPLTIVGATGPLLIFESILYTVCKDNDIHFLSFRLYVGFWITAILLIFVLFDLSSLVKYITRFTEESFAVLISLIFIVEAFKKLAGIWKTHPIHIHALGQTQDYKCYCLHPGDNITTYNRVVPNQDFNETLFDTSVNYTEPMYVNQTFLLPTLQNWSSQVHENCITFMKRIIVSKECILEDFCKDSGWDLDGPACSNPNVIRAVPDVFFLCCFLFIGTFVIAIFFRNFRTSTFFPSILRSTVSDFAVLIAIVTCTSIDMILDLDTPKLKVPSQVQNTIPGRGWFINPVDIGSWYLPVLALIPALLATILIFLDQQITAVIVNRKEHKLKKSHGYHLDLFVLAVIIALCSVMGLPWFVAATVRSITHVRSLIRESELRAPGERPQFLGVREQRFTGICIHILIGLSVFLTSVLQHVPMAVLYGVFLYMGVTSLSGVQFIDRILILFMPDKYQPDHIYLRHVPTKRVHIFTIIQIFCMVSMWVVKSIKSVAIAFPVMILALCFVRKAMDFLFNQRELFWLDHLLPETTRKAKEDKAKLLRDQGIHVEGDGCEDIPLGEGKWDELTAKRDYGVGRKVRTRKRSRQVIERYNKEKGGDASEDEAKTELMQHEQQQLGMAFRERNFDM